MSRVQIVILAAGMGTRLARPFPKPLTPLANGKTIMASQADNIRQIFGAAAQVMTVVGFKHDLIMEAFPDALYVYNELYDQTNTSKSLLKALRASNDGPVLWMNGDVVFDPELLGRIAEPMLAGLSVVAVNDASVGDEEIKYTVDGDGNVKELSKQVHNGLGEAVGINVVSAVDKPVLIEHLVRCSAQDYFERGMETAIEAGMVFRPIDISDLFAVEVDFEADLERANEGLD